MVFGRLDWRCRIGFREPLPCEGGNKRAPFLYKSLFLRKMQKPDWGIYPCFSGNIAAVGVDGKLTYGELFAYLFGRFSVYYQSHNLNFSWRQLVFMRKIIRK